MRRVFVAIAVCWLLSACSVSPISTEAATPVPKNRIFQAGEKLTTQQPESGTVIFKRDRGFLFGAGCYTRIYIDAASVADVDAGEKITLYLLPGEYILSAEATGACYKELVEVKVTVKSGALSTFRYAPAGIDSMQIYPTAF
ncbi:MAG: hypothetical protein FWF12_00500 [Betaproteobacteria bacterium]|nr:hypothetical protein [Betaproteobacteria bacterium]